MAKSFRKCTKRVEKLRAMVIGDPEVCVERARLMTESYKQTEGEPTVIRRAKAMYYVMENMPIRIDEGELIVGNSTSKHRGGMLIPELQWKWYLDEIEILSTRQWDRCAPISEQEKQVMRECLPYWEGKTPEEVWAQGGDPVAMRNRDNTVFVSCAGMAFHLAHSSVDFYKCIYKGFEELKKEIREEIAATDPAEEVKITYLSACIITLDAVICFANRYADLAEDMAEKEPDEKRREELLEIAQVCRRVPAFPARSFREGLQSMWFVDLGLRIEGPALGITFGRPDQFLYPLYKADMDSGKLNEVDAEELIALTLVKMNDMAMLMSTATVDTLGGFPTMAGITLGGLTPDGKNAVNELSWQFLEAETQVSLTVDEVIIRIAEETPMDFIERACEANKIMRGKLKFASDYTVIKQYLSEGRPIEMARDYIVAGCFTPTSPGSAYDTTAGSINVSMLLEFALNNGVSRITGEKWGVETGDPRDFKSIEDVLDALKKQVEAVIEPGLTLHSQYKALYTKMTPQPYQSILFDNCLKTGIDIADGLTAPHFREGYGLLGLVDTADALAGLKKVVFDDKRFTMSEVIDALDKNFEGYDELKQYLIMAPKFGNGLDYVDDLANRVVDIFYDEIKKYHGYKGAVLSLAAASGTSHLGGGMLVGATSDGRMASEPLAEGGISPHQGRNKSGITGTFNSVSHVNHTKLAAGSVFNLRINPSTLKNDDKVEKFAALLKAYCRKGGYHAQFNIVDTDTLRAAQEEPDKYRDLVVRVATYSALFTELSRQLQDDIITRSGMEEL